MNEDETFRLLKKFSYGDALAYYYEIMKTEPLTSSNIDRLLIPSGWGLHELSTEYIARMIYEQSLQRR